MERKRSKIYDTVRDWRTPQQTEKKSCGAVLWNYGAFFN